MLQTLLALLMLLSVSEGLASPQQELVDSRSLNLRQIENMFYQSGVELTTQDKEVLKKNWEIYSNKVQLANRYASLLDTSLWTGAGRIETVYYCLGGKGAVVAFGFQGFKCLDSGMNMITVDFSSNVYMDDGPATGLIAKDYFGLNAGVSILAGVLIHSCETSLCDIEQKYSKKDAPQDESPFDGGTINGAFLWYGAFLGYYTNPGNDILIFSWQGGLAAEISVSSINIYKN